MEIDRKPAPILEFSVFRRLELPFLGLEMKLDGHRVYRTGSPDKQAKPGLPPENYASLFHFYIIREVDASTKTVL